MVVKHSVTRPHDGLSVAQWIPRQTDARRYIVRISRNASGDSEHVLRGLRKRVHSRKFRCEFDIVTRAVVQCEIPAHAPRVLHEQSQRRITERLVRIPYALNENLGHAEAVRLYRAEVGNGLAGKVRRQSERSW